MVAEIGSSVLDSKQMLTSRSPWTGLQGFTLWLHCMLREGSERVCVCVCVCVCARVQSRGVCEGFPSEVSASQREDQVLSWGLRSSVPGMYVCVCVCPAAHTCGFRDWGSDISFYLLLWMSTSRSQPHKAKSTHSKDGSECVCVCVCVSVCVWTHKGASERRVFLLRGKSRVERSNTHLGGQWAAWQACVCVCVCVCVWGKWKETYKMKKFKT